MRARAAYISSFGTGGIIVASALLMLLFVSALVAFHGWPGSAAEGGPVASVPLTRPAQPTGAVRQVRRAATPARAVTRTPSTAAKATAAPRPVSTAGLHKGQPSAAGVPVDLVKVPSGAGPATPPVQSPPPSTGPQQSTPTPARNAPVSGPPAPTDEPPLSLSVPVPPLPGGGPADGGVQQTIDDLVNGLPPVPGQILAPGQQVDPAAPAPVTVDPVGVTLGPVSVSVGLR
jgi:hypothetical protein